MAMPHHVGQPQSELIREPHGVISVSEDYRLPATIAYNDAIAEAASLYRLDPNLIRAVINAESAFNPFAVSTAGAQGLMQLMPDVAEELDVANPFDPRQNILGARNTSEIFSIAIMEMLTWPWPATTRAPVP